MLTQFKFKLNDLYDAGVKDRNRAIIYEANRMNKVAVKTPNYTTDGIEIENFGVVRFCWQFWQGMSDQLCISHHLTCKDGGITKKIIASHRLLWILAGGYLGTYLDFIHWISKHN